MKSRYLATTLLLLLLSCTVAVSQVRDPNFKRELSLGVKAGVTIPDMALSPTVAQNTWIGYTSGVSLRYIEEKIFGLVVEFNWAQRGWDEAFTDNQYAYRRTFNYLEIPFLSHIYFGSERFHAFVNLGPQVGFMLNDVTNTNFDTANLPNFSDSNKIKESYELPVKNRFDYGITGGLGVELRFNRHIIAMEGRYYFGLGDVFGNRKSDVFSGSSANRGFVATLSYMFRLW